MSYTMIIAVALALVAVSSSALSPSTDQNALIRFYSGFAQLYRSTTRATLTEQQSTSTEHYKFLFTEQEYAYIKPESISMVNVPILERSIIYHSMPNFEVEGTRYFYRRDPKQLEAVEIELVRPIDRLFREVNRPNRYFYLPSFDGLEYSQRVPQMPYYEVNFICNVTLVSPVNEATTPAPLLSYIDNSFQWSPRYMLDLPKFGMAKKLEMLAFADVQNIGQQSMVVKGTELTAGDIKLIEKPVEIYRTPVAYAASYSGSYGMSYTRPLGEQASGSYVFQMRSLPTLVLPPRSTTSFQFLEPRVNVESFLSWSMGFSTVNNKGKLSKAYNITSLDTFLPSGRLMLQEMGRFVGELNLPNLALGEVYTFLSGIDADVSYRRQVTIIQGDEDTDKIMYKVEFFFENRKPSRHIVVDFTESFGEHKYFEVNNISMNQEQQADLFLYGSELRGLFVIPQQNGEKMFSYNVIIHKTKPIVMINRVRDQ